jgi:hypothetical protein
MNIEPLNENSFKFNTCQFRSEEPITKTIKRCSCRGGDYQISAYYCHKLEIFDLSEGNCKDCSYYESK